LLLLAAAMLALFVDGQPPHRWAAFVKQRGRLAAASHQLHRENPS
jgi:hypothetical protein